MLNIYFRQVNEEYGGVNAFVRFGSVCLSVFLCVCSGTVNQTSLKLALNANSYKMVKATDLQLDTYVTRDSPDRNP